MKLVALKNGTKFGKKIYNRPESTDLSLIERYSFDCPPVAALQLVKGGMFLPADEAAAKEFNALTTGGIDVSPFFKKEKNENFFKKEKNEKLEAKKEEKKEEKKEGKNVSKVAEMKSESKKIVKKK